MDGKTLALNSLDGRHLVADVFCSHCDFKTLPILAVYTRLNSSFIGKISVTD